MKNKQINLFQTDITNYIIKVRKKFMFFELSEVEKIESGIQSLSEIKENLDRKCLQSFSSHPQRIGQSLKNTLQAVLAESEKTLQVVKEIQDEVEMGYFVPSTFNLDELVHDQSALPEWFEFVFKKQYEKQKKNLDGLCKKAYKMQSLPEVRYNLQKEINSFRLLVERFQILTQKQKTSVNIIGEAQIISSKCKHSKEKFNNFCKSIAIKIVVFLQESVSKSLNFSNSMSSMGQSVTNSFNVKLQPQPFQGAYLTNKFRQTNPVYETDGFQRQKMMRSVDFNARSIYNKLGNDLTQTSSQFNRYVPKYVNRTVYDFYH